MIGGKIAQGALVVTCLLTALACPSEASVISTFSSDLDGWTELNLQSVVPNEGFVSWASGGGNGGGYARFEGGSSDTDGATGIVAPSKFLGSWTAYDGVGTLYFDHKIFDTGDLGTFSNYRVGLTGLDGSQAVWTGSQPAGTTDWETLAVPIQSGSWTILTGTWSGLLNNMAGLAIQIEMVANVSQGDTTGIDNVRLIPEPGTLALLALGAAGFLARRRARAGLHG